MKPKLGQKVTDRWWPWWGIGTVIAVKRTRVTIRYPDFDLTYDIPHCKFLEPLK